MSFQAAASASQGGGYGTVLLLALPLLLIAYMIFSQRRRQRQMQQMQSELEVGDEVMTSTGLYGTIAGMNETVVTLEVAPGVQVQWDRRAIVKRPQASPPAQQPDAGAGGTE
jgi:preprotein translocase subunit YajC